MKYIVVVGSILKMRELRFLQAHVLKYTELTCHRAKIQTKVTLPQRPDFLTLMQNPEVMVLKQNKAKTPFYSWKKLKESDAHDDASIDDENVSGLSDPSHHSFCRDRAQNVIYGQFQSYPERLNRKALKR